MNKKTQVLLAEDEPSLANIIKESLETRDFKVTWAENGILALEEFQRQQPEILVLDVMMPKKDGFTLAKEIRKINDTIPIIFLTAKSQTEDVVEGFSIGGNDYLKKPFSMEELIVRMNNLLNRKKQQLNHAVIEIGGFKFDFPKQTLQYKEEEKKLLTHREAHLLFHLCKNKNKLLDRSLILNKLWGNDDFFNARSMDVFITKLRKKLTKDKTIQIVNVRGYGYKIIYD